MSAIDTVMAVRARTWLPIITAPKETDPKKPKPIVDLWQNGQRITNCAWYEDGLHAHGRNAGAWLGMGALVVLNPTHWMPPPEPPLEISK